MKPKSSLSLHLMFVINSILIIGLSPLVFGTEAEDFHDRFAYHRILSDGAQKQNVFHSNGQASIKQAIFNAKGQGQGKGQRFYLEQIFENTETFLQTAEVDYNVSKSCLGDIRLTLSGLLKGEMWALQILDASGKPPSGVLDVDFVWPGQYDECVNITATVDDHIRNITTSVHGKYYRLQIKLPFKIPDSSVFVQTPLVALYLGELTYGACFPSRCSESDVKGLGSTALYVLKPELPPNLQNETNWIQKIDHPHRAEYEARPETVVCIVFLSLLTVFMLLGTLYDMFVHQPLLAEPETTTVIENGNIQDLNASIDADDTHLLGQGDTVTIRQRLQSCGILGKVLMAFSMYTNGSKILNTETTPNQVQAVNGIRVLSLGWVILGHTYYFSLALSKNMSVALDWIPRWSFQALINATFSVDSFFLLSGMLGAYLTLKEMQKNKGRINWAIYYFHRFWRLTPPYMLVILSFIGLFQYWGDGPFWMQYSPAYDVCKKYWWRNLLYIQNFFPVTEQIVYAICFMVVFTPILGVKVLCYNSVKHFTMFAAILNNVMCVGWSWYLANDMQFFIITPLILIPLYRKPVVGYVIIGILMMEQFIFRGVMSVTYGFKMNVPPPQSQLFWFDNVYQRPYSRISPYLIGILTGYILWKTNRKVKIPKLVVLMCWALSLVCVTSVVYGTLEENRGHTNSLHVDALYNALCKTTWSLGLAWIIFACNTGYGGIVTEFLSSGLWGPLGRLNYCAYLVHPIIMYVYILNQRYPLYFSDINMVYMFFGHWLMTYGVSFFVSLAFEAPMIGLERLLLRRSKRH